MTIISRLMQAFKGKGGTWVVDNLHISYIYTTHTNRDVRYSIRTLDYITTQDIIILLIHIDIILLRQILIISEQVPINTIKVLHKVHVFGECSHNSCQSFICQLCMEPLNVEDTLIPPHCHKKSFSILTRFHKKHSVMSQYVFRAESLNTDSYVT